jgi:GNAT superfamily N-acetyltransferase
MIARLVTELGYPTSTAQMSARLNRLLTSSNDVVFVAEATDPAVVVGWIHGTLSQCLEADYRMEIAGLVVNEEFHRRGIGTALVRRVETWASGQGAVQASVRCRTTRPEAHLFYERLGYRQTKTQLVLRKPLKF